MSTESDQLVLYGASLRYSTWTVRLVYLIERFNIPHTLKIDTLKTIRARKAQGEKLPGAGFVPVIYSPALSLYIHDSLAITEFLYEEFPQSGIWPENKTLRAYGRSIVAEMHAGFNDLRNACSANFCAQFHPAPELPEGAWTDILRVFELMDTARKLTKQLGVQDDGYLLGKVSAADAFYWPVLGRFHTFQVDTSKASPEVNTYFSLMWKDSKSKDIAARQFDELKDESTTVPHYDNTYPGRKLWNLENMDAIAASYTA